MSIAGRTTLGVLTSGGDAPGMNMAVWALTHHASLRGWKVLGIREGFAGLKAQEVVSLTPTDTLRTARHGGTFLGTSRLPNFPDHVDDIQQALRDLNLNHLAILGGNGSALAAATLQEEVSVVSLPATIDNDVADSDESIGFDTALNTGLALLDGMRDTAEAMPRFFALETLGGDTGFLAQALAEVGAADVLLVPERPQDEQEVIETLREVISRQRYALLVGSEGYPDLERIVKRASAALGTRSRFSRVGHAQRGGRPSARDRFLAVRFALAAIETLAQKQSGRVVMQGGAVRVLPFPDRPQTKALTEPPHLSHA